MKRILFALLCFHLTAAGQSRPNVIFIYADDLGRGMLSCYGQKIVPTPNIDRLAKEGTRFEHAYGAHLCAPARASFLTGYSDCRPGKWKVTGGGIYEGIAKGTRTEEEVEESLNRQIGREPQQVYLPQIFKKAGYITAEIGKLEWGFATTRRQMREHGWDYYYGYLDHVMCHGFYPPFVFENDQLIKVPGNTLPNSGKSQEPETAAAYKERWDRNGKAVYSEDLFLQKIVQFIRTHQRQPFFLYYPSQLPHGPVSIPAVDPVFAHNDSLTAIEKEYASMVKRLDDHVGIILHTLEELGIAKNTIVVFSSDNGHEIYYSLKGRVEKPYRNMQTGQLFDNITTKFYSTIGGDVFDGNNSMAGLKRSNWEGGVRVPLIVRWPGKTPAGKVSQQLVSNYDFLNTMADLLKVKVDEQKDGQSWLPVLLGKGGGGGHAYITYGSYFGPAIVDKDGWKLRYMAAKQLYQLYNLKNDPKEEHDLAAQNPGKAAALQTLLLKACEGNLENGRYND